MAYERNVSILLEPTQEERNEYLAYKEEQDFFDNLENGIKSLNACEIGYQKHTVLVCGGMAGFDKGLLHFLNVYSEIEKKKGIRIILLSEVTGEYRRYTALNVNIPFVCTPHLLAKEIIVLGLEITVSDEMRALIAKEKCLQEAIALLKARHPKIGQGYAEAWSYYAYCYIASLLSRIKPEKVVLWNQFYAFHRIFTAICKLKKINVEYIEFGCLPGTIEFDELGQMGESRIAKDYKNFRRRPTNSSEVRDMIDILDYLKRSGLNRNSQPERLFQNKQIYRYSSKRHTVAYFGQNDYESGIYPYTNSSRKFHSPVFKSTLEALSFLVTLSIKNEWNFVYKPHPIMKALGLELDDTVSEAQKYLIDDVDINCLIDCVDVIVTIFSQSAYIALIREKPVVMLGYMQLRGKGCTYEAFHRWQIEKKIKKALKEKVTEKQKKKFVEHCTQLKKYCLIDDMQPKELKTGRDLSLREESL